MKTNVFRPLPAICIALLLSSFHHARGDADVYWTFADGLSKSSVQINTGESVFCWNIDSSFPVTVSVTGFFPSSINPGWGTEYPFSSPGSYTMSDNFGDSCTINVGTAPPPSVTITNPVNSAVLPANTAFEIQVEATAEAGVVDVYFYVEHLQSPWAFDLIKQDTTAPYSATTNLNEGSYNLHAYVSDNNSGTASDSISVTVAAAPATPIGLENPRIAGGQFVFDVTRLAVGKTHIVECCTNLTIGAWAPVETNTAASTSRTVSHPSTAEPRFYRIYQQP